MWFFSYFSHSRQRQAPSGTTASSWWSFTPASLTSRDWTPRRATCHIRCMMVRNSKGRRREVKRGSQHPFDQWLLNDGWRELKYYGRGRERVVSGPGNPCPSPFVQHYLWVLIHLSVLFILRRHSLLSGFYYFHSTAGPGTRGFGNNHEGQVR